MLFLGPGRMGKTEPLIKLLYNLKVSKEFFGSGLDTLAYCLFLASLNSYARGSLYIRGLKL